MSTQSELKPKPTKPNDSDDEIDHIGCCCDEFTSLCGLDLTDMEKATGPIVFERLCVVCFDIRASNYCTGCNEYK